MRKNNNNNIYYLHSRYNRRSKKVASEMQRKLKKYRTEGTSMDTIKYVTDINVPSSIPYNIPNTCKRLCTYIIYEYREKILEPWISFGIYPVSVLKGCTKA